MKVTRRQFLGGGLASSCLLLTAAGAAADTTSDVEFSRHKVELPTRARGLAGLKIAFLSDIHYGSASPPFLLDQIIDKVNQEKVDLVLLGGDHLFIPSSPMALVTNRVRNPKYSYGSVYSRATLIYKDLAEKLSKLRSNFGIVSVYGNHDHWIEPRQLEKAFGDFEITLETNSVHDYFYKNNRLRLILLDDYLTGVPQPAKLSAEIPENEYRILLTHNSDVYRKVLATQALNFDLGISGHTHGGQIRAPWIGALSYRIRDLRFWQGWNTVDNKNFYTSRGIGVVEIPYRINCRPEVAIFKFVAPQVI